MIKPQTGLTALTVHLVSCLIAPDSEWHHPGGPLRANTFIDGFCW